MLNAAIRRLAGRPLRAALQLAGRAYVPGYELRDALEIAGRLAEERQACTLGYFHGPGDGPLRVAEVCCAIIDAVDGLAPRGYVSIKAPACGYDPQVLEAVVLRAKERDLLAHFDSHEVATAEPTLACVARAVALGAAVGLTVPGRWRRSPEDAAWAAALGVRVRVVKGEWPDPADPERDMRRGFLEVIDRLAGGAREVAVASHDPWLAREALLRLRAAGTPCELELLNGLPKRAMLALAAELAVPVRMYIPFGIAWRPYALSKLGDNPRMLWWLARDGMTGLYGRLKRVFR